jgi:hypothetical protein
LISVDFARQAKKRTIAVMDNTTHQWASTALAAFLEACVRNAYMAQVGAMELEVALALGRLE